MSSRRSQPNDVGTPSVVDEVVETGRFEDLSEQARGALRRLARALGRSVAQDYLASSDKSNAADPDSGSPPSSSANSEKA